MHKLARAAITLTTSLIGSWVGALLDHNNWWGWTSTIFGIIGLGVGYYLAQMLDNYIEG